MMDADEAALLEELRAISNQSATSRFQEDTATTGPVITTTHATTTATTTTTPRNELQSNLLSRHRNNSPRKSAQLPQQPPSIAPTTTANYSFTSSQEDTWSSGGDGTFSSASSQQQQQQQREMDRVALARQKAAKKDILAPEVKVNEGDDDDFDRIEESRISPKKKTEKQRQWDTTEEFDEDENDEQDDDRLDITTTDPSAHPRAHLGDETKNVTPTTTLKKNVLPWKRGGKTKVPAPLVPAPKSTTVPPENPSTLAGERGGPAEDLELLALLRGVASKAASRFDDGMEDDSNNNNEDDKDHKHVDDSTVMDIQSQSEQPRQQEDVQPQQQTLPSPTHSQKECTDVSSSLTAPPPLEMEPNTKPPSVIQQDFRLEIPSTVVTDERGGEAHDPELLALLCGVSVQNGAASRFDSEMGDANETQTSMANDTDNREVTQSAPSAPQPTVPGQSSPKANATSDLLLPPWKRQGTRPKQHQQQQPCEVEVLVAVPPSLKIEMDESPPSANPSATMDVPSTNEQNETEPVSQSAHATKDSEGNFETTTKTPPWKQRGVEIVVAEPDVEVVAALSPRNEASKASPKSGTNPSQERSTFGSERRGGEATDPELLALLRGVSAKSATSRFDDNDNVNTNKNDSGANENDTETLQPAHVEPTGPTPLAISSPKSASTSKPLPPWKRSSAKKQQPAQLDMDIVVAAKAPPKLGIQSENPSTFSGERGGAAEDPELLALLRGVSAKSAASRFDDNDNVNTNEYGSGVQQNDTVLQQPAHVEPTGPTLPAVSAESLPKSVSVSNPLPPWKRSGLKKLQPAQADVDIVVAAPKLGIQSENPSIFTGERGGAAEDPELLALLRGVSAISAASRFDDNDNVNTNENDSGVQQNDTVLQQPAHVEPTGPTLPAVSAESLPKSVSVSNPLPPWKRSGLKKLQPAQANVDIVVAAPKLGIQSEIPSTFTGERGGAAEDPELLALLRGVSAKSAASRFDDNENKSENDSGVQENDAVMQKAAHVEPEGLSPPAVSVASSPKAASASMPLPPWKRSGARKQQPSQADVDIVVAAPTNFGIQSEIQSTFTGERGGSAEDPELLALLRGVSAKSAASRFDDNENMSENDSRVQENDAVMQKAAHVEPEGLSLPAISVAASPKAASASKPLPPWKRSGAKKQQPAQPDVEVILVESASQRGFQSEIPSTFTGDRGGSADDPELLALLRGISANSTGHRFDDEHSTELHFSQAPSVLDEARVVTSIRKFVPPWNKNSSVKKDQELSHKDTMRQAEAVLNEAPVNVESTGSGNGDSLVTKSNLVQSLSDKKWSVRCQAFDFLSKILLETTENSDELVDSDSILAGLDGLVPEFLKDNNAGALDKALEFSLLYAEHCRGAGDADQARKMTISLLQKNAFSSRPSTLKLANNLTLKLMEVGDEGVSSVNAVIEALLNEGLSSKKPKVVQAAASLVLEAAYHFGAATLPLASITSAANELLSHPNAKVREYGIRIVAEICRALGSKSPIQSVIDGMKSAHVAELDALLARQPEPTPAKTGLRSRKGNPKASSASEALAVLQTGKKGLEAQKYASRPAINLVAVVAKSDYSTQIAAAKWSQKVAACETIIQGAGGKPFKLVQPSSTVNYAPIISDMKALFQHTHFAVRSKATEVLSMLAEGVGQHLYPHLRPLLTPLLDMSKDKKLTKPVSDCLDSFFGNVLSFESILDKDDALPNALDEKKQKNALVRFTALEFLIRCVRRNGEAGPKGALSSSSASDIASLCAEKLDDSDASVRKSAHECITALLQANGPKIAIATQKIIDCLKSSNPRAYKTLSRTACSEPSKPISESLPIENKSTNTLPLRCAPKTNVLRPPSSQINSASVANRGALKTAVNLTKADASVADKVQPNASSIDFSSTMNASVEKLSQQDRSAPHLEQAIMHVTGLRIPLWDAEEDGGGILEGLKSSKWKNRHDAIKSLAAYVESGQLDEFSANIELSCSSILLVVREQTRGFRETNVNIMRAIIQLFIAVVEYLLSKERLITEWQMKDGAAVAAQKIADKKLSGVSGDLLTSLCVVALPASVILAVFDELITVKSPIAHEEFLKWFQGFCKDFGADSLGSGISLVVPRLLEELESPSLKVKREAARCFGELHKQIGQRFKALTISLAKPSLVDELQKCFDAYPFDKSSIVEFPITSLAILRNATDQQMNSSSGLVLEVPKTDIFSKLPDDVLLKLSSKEGKNSWKFRKEALDELESTFSGCVGLVETGPSQIKLLMELIRILRERLSDTQINLRPLAARVVGLVLSSVDKCSQAKIGKIVYTALINSAMNDIKKPVRDASLEAIRQGITVSSLDGDGLNDLGMEGLVGALVEEVNESSIRAGGLPEILLLLQSFANSLPNLENITSSRGQGLGEKFAIVVVNCLTSSKSETRSAAHALLATSIENGIIGRESIRKATEKLKPALQRSVGPLIVKMMQNTPAASLNGKENLSVRDAEPMAADDERADAPVTPKNEKPETQKIPSPGRRPQKSSLGIVSEKHFSPSSERHPLVSLSGKRYIKTGRTVIWTEYPKEPQGSILEDLKRFWAPFLPPPTISLLFPSSGIKKQDDACDGCQLLSRALSLDRAHGGQAVEEQLDLILKWVTFALCSKETTTALPEILALFIEILKYMLEIGREFSDLEALETIPFWLEKSSSAKGRFCDFYDEIKTLLQREALLPAKRLGSVVCVAIMEGSPHSKSRALACQLGRECVNIAGLSGIGKKGLLSAAKLLSQEPLKYRSASLDLLETILLKMNGDFQRLVRICGTNLSNKARQQLEDIWKKHEKTLEFPTKNFPAGPQGHRPILGNQKEAHSFATDEFVEELPKLSLRDNLKKMAKPTGSSGRLETSSDDLVDGTPFSLSLAGLKNTVALGDPEPALDSTSNPDKSSLEQEENGNSGAAALLRARLLKIRERSKFEEPTNERFEGDISRKDVVDEPHPILNFDSKMDCIRLLLAQPPPISDNEPAVEDCLAVLRLLHAGMSGQHNPALGLDAEGYQALRRFISDHSNKVVDHLTRLIDFAFSSGVETVNAGILLPLLSLVMASLMAFFRDPVLASSIGQEELTLLIRQAITFLLDPRLSSSDILDEEKGKQMVQAINKLVVQAATGSNRHVSFLALMTLQQQLIFDKARAFEDADEEFLARLSRVVTKLFARVIREEVKSESPYMGSFDIETLVCGIEDYLVSCKQAEESHFPKHQVEKCRDLVSDLVSSLIQSYRGTLRLRNLMMDLGFDTEKSALGVMMSDCETKLGLGSMSVEHEEKMHIETASQQWTSAASTLSLHSQPRTPSKDVASLVSRLSSAKAGEEREAALDAIRRFKALHGDEELNAHLQQLSGTFRQFIEDQLGSADGNANVSHVSLAGDISMSERLRQLRSRIESTETTIQVGTKDKNTDNPGPQTSNLVVTESIVHSINANRKSGLLAPSPSKLAPPQHSKIPSIAASNRPSQSLRDRLAARKIEENTNSSTSIEAGGLGRAAALRARLEAVKQGSNK